MSNDIYTYEYELVGDIPHVGVVVFDKEYYYSVDGVQIIEPGSWGSSGPRKTYYEGTSTLTKREFEEFLKRPDFNGFYYNILHHNCLTFSNLVIKYLKGESCVVENILCGISTLNPLAPISFLAHRIFGGSSSSSS